MSGLGTFRTLQAAVQRQKRLTSWLIAQLNEAPFRVQPLAGDASERSYSRLHTADKTLILMDAPNQREDCQRFLRINARLAEAGLNVPRILASEPSEGFLLLSDLGDALYLKHLREETAEPLYGDALAALRRIQAVSTHLLPNFDAALLMEELGLFTEWLLDRHLGLGQAPRRELEAVFTLLVRNALQQPQVFVHRDYHSRNLTCLPGASLPGARLADASLPGHNPGILDHQDAVCGPITYDPVSLLKDCYLRWPRARVYGWLRDYIRTLPEHLSSLPWPQWRSWFDLMGVHRHLKASGIFARLWRRDGKPGYLADIPRTLGHISELQDDYPELGALYPLINEMLPGLAAPGRPGENPPEGPPENPPSSNSSNSSSSRPDPGHETDP